MRKNIITLLLAAMLLPATGLAANYLIVTPNDGSPLALELYYEPEISFSGTQVIINYDREEISYERSQVRSLRFADTTPTAISTIKACNTSDIIITTIDGKEVLRQSSARSIDPKQLGHGLFIIKQGNNTYKLLNK